MKWKYYNGAVVADGDILEEVRACDVHQEQLFKTFKKAFMIRYTSEVDYTFDGEQRAWWHCIKDDIYHPEQLKSKRRNEITKARKNFTVKTIDPIEFVDAIFEITQDANLGYPYQIAFSYADAQEKCKILSGMENAIILGAISNTDEKLVGYLWLAVEGNCIQMVEQKVIRQYERLAVNAALCDAMCLMFNERLTSGQYLYDGDRTSLHQTNFQDYLIKYFGFRRAYCKLNIIYRPMVKPIIDALFLLRKPFFTFADKTDFRILQKVTAVLKMEEIARVYRNE